MVEKDVMLAVNALREDYERTIKDLHKHVKTLEEKVAFLSEDVTKLDKQLYGPDMS